MELESQSAINPRHMVGMLKTRKIPRTISALLLVELSIHGFYWIFATLTHAQNKSWRSWTNPDTRVPPGLHPTH